MERVGRKDALDAVAPALGRAAMRPDVETCSGMISTRLRQRLALPVVRARGQRRNVPQSAATRSGCPTRASADQPLPRRSADRAGRCRSPSRFPGSDHRRACRRLERGTAGSSTANTALNLRLRCVNGKLVSEKPHKQRTGWCPLSSDSPRHSAGIRIRGLDSRLGRGLEPWQFVRPLFSP